jgi:hypothetical protein
MEVPDRKSCLESVLLTPGDWSNVWQSFTTLRAKSKVLSGKSRLGCEPSFTIQNSKFTILRA